MNAREQAVIDVKIDDHDAGAKLDQLKTKLSSLNDKLNEMRKTNDKLGFDKVKKEIKETEREQQSYISSLWKIENVMKNLSKSTINDLTKAQAILRRELKSSERGTAEYIAKLKQLGAVNTQLGAARKDMAQFNGEAEKGKGIFSSMKLGIMAVVGAVMGVGAGLMKIVEVRAQFEKFEAVLTNTLGSKSEARKALSDITKFAAQTPYQVNELTDSFVKLANRGIKLTMDQMRAIGDTAAATGKPFGQLVEAILDINSSERWKEIGIKSETLGNKVKLSFKEMTQEVERTEAGVMKAVTAFGNMKGVSGMMAAISNTIEGQLSNMKDAWTNMLNAVGERLSPAIKSGLAALQGAFSTIQDWAKVPISDKMKDEQDGLNVLVSSIMSLNEGNDIRKRLMDELVQKYPEFLGNLNAETVTNEQLGIQLEKINDQYKLKIRIAIAEEGLNKLLIEQTDYYKKQTEVITKLNEQYLLFVPNAKASASIFEKIKALNEVTASEGPYKGMSFEFFTAKAQDDFNKLEAQIKDVEARRAILLAEKSSASKDVILDTTIKTGGTTLALTNAEQTAIKNMNKETEKLRREHLLNMAELMQDGADKELEILRVQSMNEMDVLQDKLIIKQTLSADELKFNTQILQLMADKELEMEQKALAIKIKYNKEGLTDDKKTINEEIKLLEQLQRVKEARANLKSLQGKGEKINTEGAMSWGDAKEKTEGDLTDAQNKEIEQVKTLYEQELTEANGHNGLMLKAEENYYNRLAPIQKDYNDKKAQLQQAEWELDQQRIDSASAVAEAISSFAKEGTVAAKVALGIQKAMVIAQIVLDTQKQLSSIAVTAEGLNAFSMGIAGTAYAAVRVPLTYAMSAARIATVVGTTLQQLGAFSDGGYTQKGDKYKPVGIVHAGEYVIPQEGLQNPTLSPLLMTLEKARQEGSLKTMNFAAYNKAAEDLRLMSMGGFAMGKSQTTDATIKDGNQANEINLALVTAIAQLNVRLESLETNGVNGVWQWDAYKKWRKPPGTLNPSNYLIHNKIN